MKTDFEAFSNAWEQTMVGIFGRPHSQFLELRKRYEPHANEPTFYSGGPLQYVLFEILAGERTRSGDPIAGNKLVWELQEIIEPNGANCLGLDFDWIAARRRVRQHYSAKEWKWSGEADPDTSS